MSVVYPNCVLESYRLAAPIAPLGHYENLARRWSWGFRKGRRPGTGRFWPPPALSNLYVPRNQVQLHALRNGTY